MKDYFIYCLCADDCSTVYIGSTTNLKERVISHARHNKVFSRVFYIRCYTEDQMLLWEKQFISKFKPTYNKKLYNVTPFEGEVYWTELDQSEFTDYVRHVSSNYSGRVCPTLERVNSAISHYCIDRDVLKLRQLYSKLCFDKGFPQRLEFTSSDKLIYTYIKTRFDFYQAIGDDYMETQQDIASAVGVDVKTVSRFMKKMKTHGFIDYSTNNVGNRVLYKFVLDLV